MEASVQDEIKSVEMGRPHVVILGAGASIATCLNGDTNGLKLPSMENFSTTLKIEELLKSWEIDPNQNFEDIYSLLHQKQEKERLEVLENKVVEYFQGLQLPGNPTIYDHLILSLRDKDLIATFNWDPLLMQAYLRNQDSGLSQPKIVFLHGSVSVGFCEKCHACGLSNNQCSNCGDILKNTKLLYPIKNKNYSDDKFISSQWDILKNYIKNSFMLTVFGYSGPKSDEEAIKLMSEAWGPNYERDMEQFDVITRPEFNEEEIREVWDNFIHTHHYDIFGDFYKSWIFNHPRRTGEAYINQYIEAKYIENNPLPKDADFGDLWRWFGALKEFEESKNDE